MGVFVAAPAVVWSLYKCVEFRSCGEWPLGCVASRACVRVYDRCDRVNVMLVINYGSKIGNMDILYGLMDQVRVYSPGTPYVL